MFDCVIYHAPCPDGTCSAWIVSKYHKEHDKSIELYPSNAGKTNQLNISNFIGKSLIFVDICPDKEFLLELSQKAKYIKIIDHHKTNYETLNEITKPENVDYYFDMNFSGCQLTWMTFYKELSQPWFVQHIGDRDIWKFALENTNEYFSGMMEEQLMTLEGFDVMFHNLDNDEYKSNILNIGKKIMEFRQKNIENCCKFNKIECKYKTFRIWLVNCTSDLSSDVGNQLLKYKFSDDTYPDFSVGWRYDVISDEYYISMRSDNTKQDVSVICKEFGGGGHRNASGCTLKGNITLRDIFIPN